MKVVKPTEADRLHVYGAKDGSQVRLDENANEKKGKEMEVLKRHPRRKNMYKSTRNLTAYFGHALDCLRKASTWFIVVCVTRTSAVVTRGRMTVTDIL